MKDAAIMARCRNAAERAAVARAQLRDELVALALAGDVSGVTTQLNTLAEEAESLDERPRANAQARDERGHTLLAIAAWKGHAELAELLCKNWVQYKCPADSFLDENKTLREAWRVDVNARNCQGWTPVSLAVFHKHPAIVRVLLEHDADPTKRNSRKMSAFHLAADDAPVLAMLREWGEDRQLGVHEMDTTMAQDVLAASNPLAAVVSPSSGKSGGAKKKKKQKKKPPAKKNATTAAQKKKKKKK